MKDKSLNRIETLKKHMNTSYPLEDPFNKRVCVFTCGSLGRFEIAENSDLDLFFIIEHKDGKVYSNIEKYIFFSKMYSINKDNNFPEPSKQGEYWDFIINKHLLDIGSRSEDFNNSFTARMLLILESKPLYNEKLYNELIKEIVDRYFFDYNKHKDEFYPLFLINDILRYWYTLTLNYEYRRDPTDDENKKNWKRLKLKYARLITCYSMIACLFKPKITPDDVKRYITLTPLERLDELISFVPTTASIVDEIKEKYNGYMKLREKDPSWWNNNKMDEFKKADEFHDIVIHRLMKEVSTVNESLKNKMDLY